MMTGNSRVRSSPRMRRNTSRPSTRGNLRSSSINAAAASRHLGQEIVERFYSIAGNNDLIWNLFFLRARRVDRRHRIIFHQQDLPLIHCNLIDFLLDVRE